MCRPARFRWVSGTESIAEYRTPPSGYAARYCRTCGSPAPGEPNPEGFMGLPTGTLDQDPGSRPIFHCFVGSKAPWFEIEGDLPRYDADPPPPEST